MDDLNNFYPLGTKFKINGSIYILAASNSVQCCLIDFVSGNRYRDAVACGALFDAAYNKFIDKQAVEKLLIGNQSFEVVIATLKEDEYMVESKNGIERSIEV